MPAPVAIQFDIAVANAQMREITPQLEFVGRVKAIDKVDLRARVAGYTSGMLSQRGRFSQQYGYFEARMRWTRGTGIWPAFWLLRHHIAVRGMRK